MKKTIIKIAVFILTFFIALFVMERVMNQGHNNMTMEMGKATLPVVAFVQGDDTYNRLFGYVHPMEVAFQRDNVTVLWENRDFTCKIRPYGREIAEIAVEVRSTDGDRLVENTRVTDYEPRAEEMTVDFALKDLIEKDTRYSMAIVLTLDGDEEVRYYTDVIWSDELHAEEQFEFVRDFHERLYDKEAARELTKYLETNAQLESNQSFHKVNIHSSFKQITWGDMMVQEVGEPDLRLTGIDGTTASLLMDYYISTEDGHNTTYYRVQEYYRVRYTADRMYLLDYERTTNQLLDVEHMYANDKMLLGITDENVMMTESADGNIVVFEDNGQLICYNVVANKLAVLFSFYDSDNMDERALHDDHSIKILDVDEGGNVRFAVYGYMNRGRHEGEVGIQIYAYDSSLNTIEELVYIPYDRTFTVLRSELQQLLYMNREQQVFLFLENTVLFVDLVERTYQEMVQITRDESLQVSETHDIIVWQDGDDIYHCEQLNVRDLNNNSQRVVKAGRGEAILPLGFMGEDIIYGVAKTEDIKVENSGRIFFPMYKVCICNALGELLKEYQQNNVYVTGCSIVDNQITLERVRRIDTDTYQTISADQITNNAEERVLKNTIVVANIDRYEQYVQIQVRNTIDAKSIKVQTPKEVVFEGGRQLHLTMEREVLRYFVYGPYGVDAVYDAPATAINRAYEISGTVMDGRGNCIWSKAKRATRNQIMAIKESSADEDRNSLAVCLDTILRYEGITRNSMQLLERGETVMDILRESLDDVEILDLTGCNMDAVLYYVNQDIPVLAMLGDEEAVLLTGFNEYNVVVMEPAANALYKKGMNDSTDWFAENGNRFVTYFRRE
ncbi:MAG: hypothetical protein IJ833_11435 [Lachnospiraceae bacterium]|nr:hypothetical protein [Lachnospiraceae bacterium]